MARGLDIARRGVSHVEREANGVANSHGGAALEVATDQEGSLRRLLHLIKKQRHGVRFSVANKPVLHAIVHDESADVEVLYPVTEFYVFLGTSTWNVAVANADDHLCDPIVQI